MNLSYVGKIEAIRQIPDAERIESAIVVCGPGGKWQGCVQKGQFSVGDKCNVFLQDAILPEVAAYEHMRKHKFRVKMCRFLKTPSEVLITPDFYTGEIGEEISERVGVVKYEKEIAITMTGETKGSFPSFIPKTDEINFQAIPDLLSIMSGKEFYATLKADGTSSTFYHYNGEAGCCSRNWEKKLDKPHIYSAIDKKYNITEQLKEIGKHYAIQGEIVGPGIQKNRLGLTAPEIRVFDVWDIDNRRYFDPWEIDEICAGMKLPQVNLVAASTWKMTDFEQLRLFAERTYPNGKPAEGVVVRMVEFETRFSFKIINLLYKD
jgi:RNA ligase (TIGR02306 family)